MFFKDYTHECDWPFDPATIATLERTENVYKGKRGNEDGFT